MNEQSQANKYFRNGETIDTKPDVSQFVDTNEHREQYLQFPKTGEIVAQVTTQVKPGVIDIKLVLRKE